MIAAIQTESNNAGDRPASWSLARAVALLVVSGCSGAVLNSSDGDASIHDGGAVDGAPFMDARASDGARDTGADADHSDGHAGDGGPPRPCNATQTPVENPCVISDAYGVFVAPAASGGSDSTGNGTRTRPYATLGTGLAKAVAASKRIYACGASYPEALSVGAALDGVQAYGGLECPIAADGGVADAGTVDSATGPWSYTGKAATVAPLTEGLALDVEGLTKGAHFEDMVFVAQAADPLHAGESSIAVMVNASSGVSFVRGGATAGDGSTGATGAPPATNWCPTATQAGTGSGGYPTGGSAGVCVCPIFGSSTGGVGGNAAATVSSPGQPGADGGGVPLPTSIVPPYDGVGAVGFLPGPPEQGCGRGDVGANGAAQAGGPMGAVGTLSSTGWQPALAGAGSPGDPGQGGGGGGGDLPAAGGGGGGGAGGCGGNGGAGGGGGGASFAISIVSSAVDLHAVTLLTGSGGPGGSGAAGESGQRGALGGGGAACGGGFGGAGGGGSGGGGGAGGPSVGVVWTGTPAPAIDGLSATATLMSLAGPSTFSGGSSGMGGTGGAGAAAITSSEEPGSAGNPGSDGPAGASAAAQGF
jgi:hypothetical protein